MADPIYPKRESHFAHKAVRLMAKTCVPAEWGAEVFAMLAVIVHTEDAARYRRPVSFHNATLMQILGISSDTTLWRIRSRAVESGWLAYIPGAKRKPARYFVQVPPHAIDLDDHLGDDSPQAATESISNLKDKTEPGSPNYCKSETQCGINAESMRRTISPIPIPDPRKLLPPLPPETKRLPQVEPTPQSAPETCEPHQSTAANGTASEAHAANPDDSGTCSTGSPESVSQSLPAPQPRKPKRNDRRQIPIEQLTFPPHLDSPEVRESMADWLAYKLKRGHVYENQKHLDQLLGRFVRDFGSESAIEFCDMVNKAIVGNWHGLHWNRPKGKSYGRTNHNDLDRFNAPGAGDF